MDSNNFYNSYVKFCIFFVKLAYINLLWLLFIVLGIGILGFFPATMAMFSIVRQWIMGNNEGSIFNSFWNIFKREFITANVIGASYVLIGFIIYFDILYFSTPESIAGIIIYYFFWLVAVIYVLFGIFIFPVYVHYENGWWKYYKSTLMIMVLNPLTVIVVIFYIFGIVFLLRILPGLIPFFSGSAIGYMVMLLSYRSFIKTEQTLDYKNGRHFKTVDSEV